MTTPGATDPTMHVQTPVPVTCSQCGHEGKVCIDVPPLVADWINGKLDGMATALRRVQTLLRAGEPVPLSLVDDALGGDET